MIASLLLSKYQNQTLAPFYTIKCSNGLGQEKSLELIEGWLNKFFQKLSPAKNIYNHSDILTLCDVENSLKRDKDYTVDEVKELMQFNQFRPMELKHKWIIIPSAAHLNELVANKLLKLLEEPQPYLSVLLLNPTNMKLLPTIESRTIELRLSPVELGHNIEQASSQSQLQFQEMAKQIKGLALHQFIDSFKNKEDALIEAIGFFAGQSNNADFVQSYLQDIQDIQKSKAMNVNAAQRLHRIYHLFQAI